MDYKKACEILEIPENATEDQIKKQFKKLAAKYHPDINKDPNAESKSKEISEAYNFLKDYKEPEQNPFQNVNWSHINFDDLFNNPFGNPFGNGGGPFRYKTPTTDKDSDIYLNLKLSFEEGILGGTKEIEYERIEPCPNCFDSLDNSKKCKTCNPNNLDINPKLYKVKKKRQINLSSGLGPGQQIKIRINDSGNYSTKTKNSGALIVNLIVEKHSTMHLVNHDIVSHCNISLLDALTGITIKVQTLHGEKEVKIKPFTKNMDNLKLRGGGVPGLGDHILLIHVDYPSKEKVDKIINILKE